MLTRLNLNIILDKRLGDNMETENAIYTCLKCPGPKTYGEMSKDKNRPDGIKKVCKECENKRIKTYQDKSSTKAKEVGINHRLSNLEEGQERIEKTLKLLVDLIERFTKFKLFQK